MLYEKLNNILKTAMKNKDVDTTNFARSLKTKINEYLIANNLDRENVADENFVVAARAYRKFLLKGADELKKGGDRMDSMVSSYVREADFCSQFLPAGPSRDDMRRIVQAAVEEAGSEANVGRVIGLVMRNNKGLDGKIIKELVMDFLK